MKIDENYKIMYAWLATSLQALAGTNTLERVVLSKLFVTLSSSC